MASLQAEVKREPVLALDGGGRTGLLPPHRPRLRHASLPGGTLLMEVGAGQAADVAAMFPKAEIIAIFAE